MYVFHVVIMSPCKYCKVNKDRLCFYDVQIQGEGEGVKFRILARAEKLSPGLKTLATLDINLKSLPATLTDHNS